MVETTPRNQPALEFLLSRRSRPYKTLQGPIPNKEQILELLQGAARSPDHGKLEPFRFIVLSTDAMLRLSQLAVARGETIGLDPEAIEKMRFQLSSAPLAVAVVASPKPSEKIPDIEQQYAACCACLALLNTALAAGWGANWLTGWAAHDAEFLRDAHGIEDHEKLIGWVHIGTARAAPPDRPRPDLEHITEWVSS